MHYNGNNRFKVMAFDKELAVKPNKYAPKSGYIFEDNTIKVSGYQNFSLTLQNNRMNKLETKEASLALKCKIVRSAFHGRLNQSTRVLDLGGNNGFYSLLALFTGAGKAKVVDIDAKAIENVCNIARDSKTDKLEGYLGNISEFNEPHDVVIALALVHWIFNLTTGFGCLEEALNHLQKLSKKALIVEWVDPKDPAIEIFKHTSTAKDQNKINAYNENNFISILSKMFDTVKLLGNISETRKIYLASNNSFNFDLSWGKLLYPEDSVKSSKELCKGTDNKPIYSRCYVLNDKVVKQTSPIVGKNEAAILERINHPCVPKLLNFSRADETTILEIEKVPGQTLSDLIKSPDCLTDSDLEMMSKQFIDLLHYLDTNGIVHRDISPENILWCSSKKKLHLIDFGWSTATGVEEIFTPNLLGAKIDFVGFIDKDMHRCDSYAASALLSLLPQNNILDIAINDLLIKSLNQNRKNTRFHLRKIQELQVKSIFYT